MPLNLVRPEVPVELAALVAKMMAKEPERRFQAAEGGGPGVDAVLQEGGCGLQESERGNLPGRSDGSGSAEGWSRPDDRHRAGCPTEGSGEAVRTRHQWKSLIDVGETERSRNATPAVGRMRRPQWLWPSVAVGALLLGLLIAWGVIIRVKTTNGMIELLDLPKDAEVLVNGKEFEVKWPGGGKPAVITVDRRQTRVQGEEGRIQGIWSRN